MATFAEFLLERQAVSAEDLLRCIDYRRWLLPFIGTLAVNRGILNAVQVLEVLEQCENSQRQFGDVATELGLLTHEQLESLLEEQSQSKESLNRCLVRLGILSRVQLEDLEGEYRQKEPTNTLS